MHGAPPRQHQAACQQGLAHAEAGYKGTALSDLLAPMHVSVGGGRDTRGHALMWVEGSACAGVLQ